MHSEITTISLPESDRGSPPEVPVFGAAFEDHMFRQHYHPERGWHDATIAPLENISLHSAAAVLHYGQEIFEGLKAFRRDQRGWTLTLEAE